MSRVQLGPGVKLEWRGEDLFLGDCKIGKVEPKRWEGKNTSSFLATMVWPHEPFTSVNIGNCKEWAWNRAIEWLRKAGLAT